jgi:integrase
VLSQRDPSLPKFEVKALSAKTFTPIRKMFAWGKASGYAPTDPFETVTIEISRRERRKQGGKSRDSFTVEQLQRLFDAPAFSGCRSERQWTEPGDMRIDDTRFWVPLLALFSGARRGELVSLRGEDIFQQDGVWCIRIDERYDDDGNLVATVKNEHSVRVIPVHPELERLGFLDFVRKKGRGNLFDPNGDKLGKFFARLLSSLDMKSQRLVFHSFRHSFEDAMLEGIEDFAVRFQITGRESGHSSALYQTRLKPRVMLEKLSQVRFDGLDLTRLYPENAKWRGVAAELKRRRGATQKRTLVSGKLRGG